MTRRRQGSLKSGTRRSNVRDHVRAPAAVRLIARTPCLGALTRRKDCEDRLRSLMVLGCGLVTAGVTPGKTGFVPCCDLSARGRRPRTGWRSWPDQELDHLALASPGVSHHSPAEPPSRTGTTSRPEKERTHGQSDRSA